MTSPAAFAALAVLLLAATLALLLPALLRQRKPVSEADRRESNLAIFRDQLGELERERAEGSLSEEDFAQARRELQRRLLDETASAEAPASTAPAGRKTAIALVVALPLAAAAGYLLLGTPQGLDPLQTRSVASGQEIEDILGTLVARLEKNPDDAKGWVMLARSYKALGRFAEAAEAYGKAGPLVDEDASLLADHADALAQAQGGTLQGKPGELIARALKLNPDEPQALLLAGAAAIDRQDFAAAAEHWTRLLKQLEPGSEEAQTIEQAIARAREIAAQAGKDKAAAGPALSGEVRLSPQLAGRVKPDDVVFVFARAGEGSRMPLAAVRATAADLPLRFRLDDSMSLAGGRKLSEFKTVSIEARVARAGQAQSSSGDLFGVLDGISPGSSDLRLIIDRVQP
jgi:cytochrome c-type biogenesis protein CcmH